MTPARLFRRWAQPVDIASLAAFRIAVGSVLAWELWRYLALDFPHRYYVEPPLHFTFWPFDWVRPLPTTGITWLFIGLSLVAAMVAVGAFYRVACVVLWLGMTYIFLMDSAFYLNHWYLATLLCFLLAFVPAHQAWSIDTRSGAVERRDTVPAWTVGIFRFQFGIVYLFAGLAKIEADWLEGRPLHIWLDDQSDFPVIGQWLTERPVAQGLAIAAMVFDVAVAFLLMSHRTRRYAYVVALGFHLMNSRLFAIGMFPWAMMLGTAIFFPTDFPRRLADDLANGIRRIPVAVGAVTMAILAAWIPREFSVFQIVAGAAAGAIAAYHLAGGDRAEVLAETADTETEEAAATPPRAPALARPVRWALGAWIAIQLLLPLRPYVYPGNASWTEEGQQFAWRLLLRTKSGIVTFQITDPTTGETIEVEPETLIRGGQLNNLAEQPDLMVQFARWLEEEYRPRMGGRDLEVRASSSITLNGHRPRELVDPDVDLTRVERPWLPPAEWIRGGP